MKITLDIPDGIIAGFFNDVEVTAHGMQLLNAGATKEEAFVLLQSFISASIHGNKEDSDEN